MGIDILNQLFNLVGRKKESVTLSQTTAVDTSHLHDEPITEADRDAAFQRIMQILIKNSAYPSLIGLPQDTQLVVDKVVDGLRKNEDVSTIRISPDETGKVTQHLLLQLCQLADSYGASYRLVDGGIIQNIGYVIESIAGKFAELNELDKRNRRCTVLLEHINKIDEHENDDLILKVREFSNSRARNDNLDNVSFLLTSTEKQHQFVKDAKRSPYNAGVAVEIKHLI